MNIARLHVSVTLLFVLAATPAQAQRGDRGDQKQPEVWKQMDVPAAPPLSPAEALKSFRVAPGFRLELAAAEPLVEDPVAIAWDADGRLWAVEMRGYMPNVDGTGEDVRNGQVVVLEDEDGDGHMDRSTVFLDGLQMPRAIAMVQGGVLIAEPPKLWYCRDTDGDLKCDEKIEVHGSYARQGPVEHTDNGLLWTIDNRLYNAKSSKRFRFELTAEGPKLIEDQTKGRGQWGITADDYGRLYYNSNSNYLQGDYVTYDYYGRNPNYEANWGVGRGMASDQNVWSIRVNPGINRGYQNHMLRDDGRLSRTTATCGPGVYRGDQFPAEYAGDLFIPEPGGNVVAHFRMEEKDDGSLRAQHIAYDDEQWEKREFLASTDERFRPVNCYTGPDGCLYVVDMYRGILQHKVYVTTFLRKQILERGLDKPIGMGRIYRIVHEGSKPAPPPQLSKAPAGRLVEELSHANGWRRDTAQRLLVGRGDVAAVPALRELAASGGGAADPFAEPGEAAVKTDHRARIHALWTLHGLDALDYTTVHAAVRDEHPKVRMTALRMSEPLLNGLADEAAEQELQKLLLADVLAMAGGDQPVPVRRQLAFSLGNMDMPEVGAAMRAMLLAHADDESFREALISGFGGRELEMLGRLLSDEAWAERGSGRERVLHDLAGCVTRERSPQRVARMLELIASQSPDERWRQVAMLDGVIDVALPNGRKPKPMHYDEQPLAMAKLAKADDKAVKDRVEKLAEFVTFGAAAAPPPPPPPLSARHQAMFDHGKTLYLNTCASCHLPSGLGEEGKAPPLLDSPWLLGTPQRVVRIVLHGLSGPIEVHGRMYNMDMPPLQGFNDEQIAAILTYARREWEHGGEPIEPGTVTEIREATAGREKAWTVEELLKVQ